MKFYQFNQTGSSLVGRADSIVLISVALLMVSVSATTTINIPTTTNGILLPTPIVPPGVAVSFNQRIYTVNEADRLLEVLLVLSNPALFDVTVTVFNTDGSAIGGNDYTPGPYTVTFPIGSTNASFVVSISDDTFEDNENFNVTIDRFVLSNGVVIGNYGQATVMIIDDDPIPTINFHQSTYSVNENNGAVRVMLVLSNPSSLDITVQVFITNGSATGQDFDNNSGPYTITIPATETSASFEIAIVDNNILETDEDFILTIQPLDSSNVTIGNTQQTTVIILDDDGK